MLLLWWRKCQGCPEAEPVLQALSSHSPHCPHWLLCIPATDLRVVPEMGSPQDRSSTRSQKSPPARSQTGQTQRTPHPRQGSTSGPLSGSPTHLSSQPSPVLPQAPVSSVVHPPPQEQGNQRPSLFSKVAGCEKRPLSVRPQHCVHQLPGASPLLLTPWPPWDEGQGLRL